MSVVLHSHEVPDLELFDVTEHLKVNETMSFGSVVVQVVTFSG